MALRGGIWELDLHGMTTVQAKVAVDAALRRCDKSVYRLRLIHGYSAFYRAYKKRYGVSPAAERTKCYDNSEKMWKN